jgi:uncharacterized protein
MIDENEKPAWLVLLLVSISALAGLLMGTAIGTALATLFYTGDGDLLQAMANPSNDQLRIPLLIVQGVTSLCGFLIAPYFVWKALTKKTIGFFQSAKLNPNSILLSLLIVVAFAIADSAIIEWNQNISFPSFLKSFEEWARAKENELADLTKMLTNFKTVEEFALAFLVVAVFAGISEEFLFRGVIQHELLRGTKNIHVAIWISAIVFSAIHAQFFGFVPRVLLGALFGYLYYWSGNLLVPIFAHLFNNGFSLTMIYLFQLKIITTDIDKPEVAPWPVVVACFLFTAMLLYFFKKRFFTSTTLQPS